MECKPDFVTKISSKEIDDIIAYCKMDDASDTIEYLFNFTKAIIDDNEKNTQLGDSTVLLYGPPNSGKTTITYYLFSLLKKRINNDYSYLKFDIPNAISSDLGGTGKNIQELFNFILKHDSPILLVIDEMDQLCMSRSKENEHDAIRRGMSSLMLAIDKFKLAKSPHTIVGITNIPEALDSAILRRFFLKKEIAQFFDLEYFSRTIKHFSKLFKIDEFGNQDIQSAYNNIKDIELTTGDIRDVMAKISIEKTFLNHGAVHSFADSLEQLKKFKSLRKK